MWTTDLFRGWNDAETTGASKRTTALRFGGSLSDARSHMQTFQSLLEVSMYRAFLEKLCVVRVAVVNYGAQDVRVHSMTYNAAKIRTLRLSHP